LARPADQALLYARANSHASRNVVSGDLAPSLITVEGAPWMSACAYRSPSLRCFLTSWSFVRASRPPRIRCPSEERAQRYASNQKDFVALMRGFFRAFTALALPASTSTFVFAIASSAPCPSTTASLRRSCEPFGF